MAAIGDRIIGLMKVIKESILPHVEKSNENIKAVAKNSHAQSLRISVITNAISSLNEIIQQNAPSSEELTTSSEELMAQASMLEQQISFFKIEKSSQINPYEKSKTNKVYTEKKTNIETQEGKTEATR